MSQLGQIVLACSRCLTLSQLVWCGEEKSFRRAHWRKELLTKVSAINEMCVFKCMILKIAQQRCQNNEKNEMEEVGGSPFQLLSITSKLFSCTPD